MMYQQAEHLEPGQRVTVLNAAFPADVSKGLVIGRDEENDLWVLVTDTSDPSNSYPCCPCVDELLMGWPDDDGTVDD